MLLLSFNRKKFSPQQILVQGNARTKIWELDLAKSIRYLFTNIYI